MQKPVIFIHGLKGARLVTPAGRCDWLTGAMALGLRTPDLALPCRFEGDRQAGDDRAAAAPLDKVTVVPWVLEENVYGPWLETLRRSGRPWRAFAYDWRRDNAESATAFKAFVEQVRREFGDAPVDIVAHSMGGLIALAALHGGLRGVERALFAGSPLQGGIGFLEDLHAGTRTGLNRAVLAPAVLATFPSVYAFFPLTGAKLFDAAGEPLAIDLFSIESWRENQLGMFQPGRRVPAAFEDFLRRVLAAARDFRSLVERRIDAYPSIEVLVGDQHATLDSLCRRGTPGAYTWDFQQPGTQAGDGRVCAANALPPGDIPHRRHASPLAHADLLNDPYLTEFLLAN